MKIKIGILGLIGSLGKLTAIYDPHRVPGAERWRQV